MGINYSSLRKELKKFYFTEADSRADKFAEACFPIMDKNFDSEMTVMQQKVLQYRVITDMFEPVLFYNSPFYYEMGTMSAHCDGARHFRGNHTHAGAWVYDRNQHLFIDQDPKLWEKRCSQSKELFYLICGPYNDTSQHFAFNYRPVFKTGLKGIYEEACGSLKTAETAAEKDFLQSLCSGLLCLEKISEKFSLKAIEMSQKTDDTEKKANMLKIAKAAARTPWEKPESFYEALNIYAFLRKTMGALEGIGFNSFGRVDMDLYPFYVKDISEGKLSADEAYELICKFLITFDMHYDHDMKMVGYADHELENTYVLGGCDLNGNPFYNDLTRMFLRAAREEKTIFPKIKCRYSKNSPKEYLDEINIAVINGTSTVLYQNDDAVIPALIRAGRTPEEARDYIVTGCWGMICSGIEKPDDGSYLNLLKPFEYSIHDLTDKMQTVGMNFKAIDNAGSFEEIYNITIGNIRILIEERIRITREGGNIWNKVDALPLFSSTLGDCIKKKRDYTEGGAKYRDDKLMCFGLPNITDSLLAIRELCFESKKYSLSEMLTAVRNNWDGYESMRAEAVRCRGWGDGNSRSCELANRINNDLYEIFNSISGTYGGKILLGHLTYTEIRWWGEKTLATPDGRRNGEYFAQGLTPSRLKHIPSVTSVVNSMATLDASKIAGNNVVNIILPLVSPAVCESFLRTAAGTAIQSLQLNCVTKEQLLDAQKHPEDYPDLIIRVCGFSAKFTSLSPEWQNEVITRNFYE